MKILNWFELLKSDNMTLHMTLNIFHIAFTAAFQIFKPWQGLWFAVSAFSVVAFEVWFFTENVITKLFITWYSCWVLSNDLAISYSSLREVINIHVYRTTNHCSLSHLPHSYVPWPKFSKFSQFNWTFWIFITERMVCSFYCFIKNLWTYTFFSSITVFDQQDCIPVRFNSWNFVVVIKSYDFFG